MLFCRILCLLTVLSVSVVASRAQQATIRIAKLKYSGGGDWYANKTALPNLIAFCKENLGLPLAAEEDVVEVGSPDIFQYPFVYMTGHGHVSFSPQEAQNLRNYLIAGGFLHIDDNYGLYEHAVREMKKVFPELEFVELPFNHPVYHMKYDFPQGLPKIHEHDGKPPQGLALIYEGRVVCFFSYESDLGNGWEDQSIYNDPEELRQQALRMGANLLLYAFTYP